MDPLPRSRPQLPHARETISLPPVSSLDRQPRRLAPRPVVDPEPGLRIEEVEAGRVHGQLHGFARPDLAPWIELRDERRGCLLRALLEALQRLSANVACKLLRVLGQHHWSADGEVDD